MDSVDDASSCSFASPFGVLLLRHRLAAGLSQEALAERARIGSDAIGALERGRRRAPHRDTVALLVRALGLAGEQQKDFEAAVSRSRTPSGSRADAAAVSPVSVLPPALRPTTNLPVALSNFVGRNTELTEIAALVRDHRLVTLTGPGGIGKTRTALQVGRALSNAVSQSGAELLEGFADGVWIVELAPLGDGSRVASAIAYALGVEETTARPILETVVAYLKHKRLLLILDNCEHVIAEVSAIADTLLRSCPHLRILATSRESLRITGERTYRLPSLAVPTPQDAHRLSGIGAGAYAAMVLFAERAQASDHEFALSDDNAPTIAEICRRLDGIPLAIELAAARVTIFSVRALLVALDQRFRILTGGNRAALPRQQTMRALIDWSHDLLDDRERTLFRRLGIFVNGFTLEGAIAVGSGEADELDVFDVLASLLDKSLVMAEPKGDTLHYRLLESPHAYAVEKLATANERELLATRHLHFLRDRFAALRERVALTSREADLAHVLATELDDVRTALDSAPALSEVVAGGELLADIGLAWRYLGLEGEGITRCETYVAALPAGESGILARILTSLSLMAAPQMRGLEFAKRAVEEARVSGQSAVLAAALVEHAAIASLMGRFDDANKAFAEAEAIPNPSVLLRLRLLFNRGQLNWRCGDYNGAARTFEQLRNDTHLLGNGSWVRAVVLALAGVNHSRGQTHRAITLVREALPEMRSSADASILASALLCVAAYHAAAGEIADADAAAREALGLTATRAPDGIDVPIGIELLALVYALRGNLARAATLEGYADEVLQQNGVKREPTDATTHDRLDTILRTRLTPDQLQRLMEEGAALTPDSALALALAP